MHAQMDVSFKGGSVRVEGYTGQLSVAILDEDYDERMRVTTNNADDLRHLAKALNQVADFIEGGENE